MADVCISEEELARLLRDLAELREQHTHLQAYNTRVLERARDAEWALARLVSFACEMRRLQRAWFGGDKSRETLLASKAAERAVDTILAEIDAGRPAQGSLGLEET